MVENLTLYLRFNEYLSNALLGVFASATSPLTTLLFLGTVGLIGFAKVSYSHSLRIKREELYLTYQLALGSGDILQAYEAGLAYYTFHRKDKFTLEEEQAFYHELVTRM